MNAHITKPWAEMTTKERIAALRPLSKDGVSASFIAGLLGTTKNSIVSHWHRHAKHFDRERIRGVEARARQLRALRAAREKKAAQRPATSKETPIDAKAEKEARLRELKAARIIAGEQLRKLRAGHKAKPHPPIQPLPQMVTVDGVNWPTILTIEPGQCRWPLFDDARVTPLNEMFFCGEPTDEGCSWCTEHHKRIFRPAPPRPVVIPRPPRYG